VGKLLAYMQSETVGIDMAIYHLYDNRVSQVLVAKHQAGVPVRVIADRHAYNSKSKQAREMNYLASRGVPVHTNRHRGLVHHKVTILHGLGLVLHGSMNYTAAARKTFDSSTGQYTWGDEISFFTTNPAVVARFKERFERMWRNTGPTTQTLMVFQAFMDLQTFDEAEATPATTCYENPPASLPADDPAFRVCFVADQHCNLDLLVPLIKAETRRMDLLIFRVTSFEISDPLVEKVRAGLPVRIIFDRGSYNNPGYPNMTTVINNLWAAGGARGNLQLKATAHAGSMHIKSLITPDAVTWGSGNISRSSSKAVRNCQTKYYQDEDLTVARDPALVAGVQRHFDKLWASADFATFDGDDIVPTPGTTPTPTPAPSPTP
jgi:phosphatidylserine/phosphatidylglycerophosphate/cardiolipin synthase-like enzyme